MKSAYILKSNLRCIIVIEGATLGGRTYAIGGAYPFSGNLQKAVTLPAKRKASDHVRHLLAPKQGLFPPDTQVLVESAFEPAEFWLRVERHLSGLSDLDVEDLLIQLAVLVNGHAPHMARYVADEKRAKARIAIGKRRQAVDNFLAAL